MTLPAAILLPAAVFLWKRSTGASRLHPVVSFFTVAYAAALVLFGLLWGLHGGFPQFSELGWI